MADVSRGTEGEIERITYRDYQGHTAEVHKPGEKRIRLWTHGSGAVSGPVDLDLSDARRFAHDILDLVGEEKRKET